MSKAAGRTGTTTIEGTFMLVVDRGEASDRYFIRHLPTEKLCCRRGHPTRTAAIAHGTEDHFQRRGRK